MKNRNIFSPPPLSSDPLFSFRTEYTSVLYLFKVLYEYRQHHILRANAVWFLKYAAVIHCCLGAEWTWRWVKALFWFRCAARCGEVTFSWLFRSGSSAWEFCFRKCCQNIVGYFFFQWKIQNRKNRWTRNLTSCQNKYFDLPFLISWHPGICNFTNSGLFFTLCHMRHPLLLYY